MCNWFCLSKLSLNIDKISYILFSSKQDDPKNNINIDNIILRVFSNKFLAVTIDQWRNTKLPIFKDLYGQAKHKVSKLVHTAKCKFYTERIALASSSKELQQIVNTLSNRHPPKILPTIYPSADLPSIFIKHFTNKVEKLRANIASEHVTSTLVTGTTAATFSSFEKVSQLTFERMHS